MSALILRNHSHNNITIVENDFIDHYMVSANGEYVKVYLLLLRYQNIPEQLPDIPQMADLLENTEGDILRALKYWEKEGILSLEYDETNELAGICIGKAPTHQTPVFQLIYFHISKRILHLPHSLLPFMKNLRSRSLMEIPLFQTKLPVRIFLHQDVPLLQEEN